MVKGIEKLNDKQKERLFRINEQHTQSVGDDYKSSMKIVEVYVDTTNTIWTKLLNGEWYRYTNDGKWF